ncbi:MAG: D-alanyl-D-alanine carboxypeptidase [Roseburia sp.]|nr:D-alanyl-D-alanine carboxypeptidase [Roseburia sp.]
MKRLKKGTGFLSLLLCSVLLAANTFTTYATEAAQEREERKALPIQSNEIPSWPEGPVIGAESAILMEMNTHTILYSKNIHEKMYPASTTKILTCLLAMQNCSLDETITFSHEAIYNVPTDGSKLGGVDEGDTMNLENALYAVLVESANDVANAVGEHVAQRLGKEKSEAAFAALMNEKAQSLGCTDSHFVNANGLFDENHYTSAYDLALIGCEFFNNELLCKMASTPRYHFKLKEEDTEDAWISSKNQLYKGKTYEYEYLLGSKTGYVSQSRQTLVSAAEKNGMKLVCVILCEDTPYQFEDTVTLFQYGFENFTRLSISDNETKYKINSMDSFDTSSDLFGDSTPLITMESDKYVILPNAAEFSDMESALTYHNSPADDDSGLIATVNYSFSGVPVGSCGIIFSKSSMPTFRFSSEGDASYSDSVDAPAADADGSGSQTVIFVNVKRVILGIAAVAGIAIVAVIIVSTVNSYSFSPKGQSNKRRRQRKRENRIAKRQARKSGRSRRRRRRQWKRKRR